MNSSRNSSLEYSDKAVHIAAEFSVITNAVNLWFLQEGDKVAELVYHPYDPGWLVVPSVSMSQTQAQYLMDQLWRCGLRPTEDRGSVGVLAATERHLADFRAIVSECLKVELPQCK